MGRCRFLLGSAVAGLVIAAGPCPSSTLAQTAPDLDKLTAAQAATDICAGKVTSTALTSAAIARAKANAKLNAFITLDEAGAMKAAAPYDIFVNNAGTNRPGPFVDVLAQDFDFVMNLNLRAAFFSAQSVTRSMIAAGKGGSIINVSSQMGQVGGANWSLYCASKWAMEGFSRAMAIELGSSGIRVNTLCPTFIETPMTKPFFEDTAFKQSVLSKIKLGRLGTVEDLMGAIVFLASDASSLMTGSSLVVDGGWTAE